MDKQGFLSRLEQSLSVLQEDELRDILNEYEQHIDMKMEKGLTEEEAIADFGGFEELTAELLEAYHVRADYVSGAGKGKDEAKTKGRHKEKGQGLLGKIKQAGSGLLRERKPGGRDRNIRQKVRDLAKWFCRPVSWLKKTWESRKYGGESIQKRKEGKNMMRAAGVRTRALAVGVGRGLGNLCRLAIHVILWGVRMMWNSCWILFSLFMTGVSLLGLYGLGLIAVLLMQGYPLTGVLVGCVGLVLCTFSAAGLGISFLWKRRVPVKAAFEDTIPHRRNSDCKVREEWGQTEDGQAEAGEE